MPYEEEVSILSKAFRANSLASDLLQFEVSMEGLGRETPAQIESRFWELIEKGDGCWLWRGPLMATGYGRFVVHIDGKPRGYSSHRVAYEWTKGPIPEGLTLDHLCRNRACPNPAHLEAVTSRENTLRGEGPSARNAHMERCPRGHQFSPVLWDSAHETRLCMTCRRNRQRVAARIYRRERRILALAAVEREREAYMKHSIMVGRRGCAGLSNRHRGIGHKTRPCSQQAIVERDGRPYCYYHDPESPRRFGEGKYSMGAFLKSADDAAQRKG